MLTGKWKTSVKQVESAKTEFKELSDALDEDLRIQWATEEKEALAEGGDAMAVYGVRLEEGKARFCFLL